MSCSWLGGAVVGKGESGRLIYVRTSICGEEATGDRLARDAGAAEGCMWTFHGKVPFPQAEIVSTDPDRRLDTHESNCPSVTTQDRQMCTVASRNRSLSSQLLAHREERLVHSTTRIYLLLSGSLPFSFSFVHSILVMTRITDPHHRS